MRSVPRKPQGHSKWLSELSTSPPLREPSACQVPVRALEAQESKMLGADRRVDSPASHSANANDGRAPSGGRSQRKLSLRGQTAIKSSSIAPERMPFRARFRHRFRRGPRPWMPKGATCRDRSSNRGEKAGRVEHADAATHRLRTVHPVVKQKSEGRVRARDQCAISPGIACSLKRAGRRRGCRGLPRAPCP